MTTIDTVATTESPAPTRRGFWRHHRHAPGLAGTLAMTGVQLWGTGIDPVGRTGRER